MNIRSSIGMISSSVSSDKYNFEDLTDVSVTRASKNIENIWKYPISNNFTILKG